jgi:hypothetical protein
MRLSHFLHLGCQTWVYAPQLHDVCIKGSCRWDFKYVPLAALSRAAVSWQSLLPGYVSLFFELAVSLSVLDLLYCNWKQPKGWISWIQSGMIGVVKKTVVLPLVVPFVKSKLKQLGGKKLRQLGGVCGRAAACVCVVVVLAEVPAWTHTTIEEDANLGWMDTFPWLSNLGGGA